MCSIPSLIRTRRPRLDALSFSEVKSYLKIDHNNDNYLIWNLITTITECAEKYLRTSLVNQTWMLTYEVYAPLMVTLPMGPVQDIVSIVAIRRDESYATVSPDCYYLSAKKKKLLFKANILSCRTEIVYNTGYGLNSDYVPEPIKQGLLSHISSVYDGNCGGNVIPQKCQDLYNPYKELSYA